MKKLTEIEHLSYSSISAYLYCPRSWKFKYLENIPTVGSPALVFGSAMHGAIESYITSDRKKTPVDHWQAAWNKATEGQQINWGDTTRESICNDGIRILSNDQVIYGLNTVLPGKNEQGGNLVEQKVELHVPDVPIPIIGYIDVQTGDGTPGDFKTSSRSWTQDQAQKETQSLFYLAALNQAGFHEHSWRFRHYVLVKTKTPQFQVFEHTHQPGELFWLFGMIKSVWKGLKAGVFPENPTGWKCCPEYCDFWSLCRGKYM